MYVVSVCRAGVKGDTDEAPLSAALEAAQAAYCKAAAAAAGNDSIGQAEVELQNVKQRHAQVRR